MSDRKLWLDVDEDGWCVLRGGGNWASVEGDREEWTVIAACLRNRTAHAFKRVALNFDEQGAAHLCSPRNAMGANDVVRVAASAVDLLADNIVAALSGV